MADPKSDLDPIDWSLTTWEGATREKLRRWAELSLEEILRAQEEMAGLAERFGQGLDSEGTPSSGASPQTGAGSAKARQSRN